ncbi:unnamed protein product, partial [Hapterophycus canaliculatus]
DADSSAVSFRYRRPDQPGKVYLFKTAGSGESAPGISGERGPAQFFLGERGVDIRSADMNLEPLQLCHPNFFEAEGFFETLFSVFRREVLSHIAPPPAAAEPAPAPANIGGGEAGAPASGGRPSPSSGKPRPVIPDAASEDHDPLRIGPPRFAGPPGVGGTPFIPGRGGDFGGDLFPSGVGGVPGVGGGGLTGPGGLLGPGDPRCGGGGGRG